MKRLVTVEFLFEGIINENENGRGVTFGNQVLVVDEQGYGLYNAKPTDRPYVYVVDLDSDGQDFINNDHLKLLDLMTS
jgi:hypothetical protein